jgi:2-iminobutanoate/2-iminopropanoate deaminase
LEHAQTLEVLRKLEALVVAAGGSKRNLIKLVIYLIHIDDKDEVARARREFFGEAFPCSTLVGVQALVFPELRVEIDAWARLDVVLG